MVPATRADATTPLPIVEPFGHPAAQRCPAGKGNHRRCRRAQRGAAGVEISGSGTLAEPGQLPAGNNLVSLLRMQSRHLPQEMNVIRRQHGRSSTVGVTFQSHQKCPASTDIADLNSDQANRSTADIGPNTPGDGRTDSGKRHFGRVEYEGARRKPNRRHAVVACPPAFRRAHGPGTT
jgi:hypothetical protein